MLLMKLCNDHFTSAGWPDLSFVHMSVESTVLTRPTQQINIARGTTDPEIDSVTWIEFGNNMAPLALVVNFPTRWHHLH